MIPKFNKSEKNILRFLNLSNLLWIQYKSIWVSLIIKMTFFYYLSIKNVQKYGASNQARLLHIFQNITTQRFSHSSVIFKLIFFKMHEKLPFLDMNFFPHCEIYRCWISVDFHSSTYTHGREEIHLTDMQIISLCIFYTFMIFTFLFHFDCLQNFNIFIYYLIYSRKFTFRNLILKKLAHFSSFSPPFIVSVYIFFSN